MDRHLHYHFAVSNLSTGTYKSATVIDLTQTHLTHRCYRYNDWFTLTSEASQRSSLHSIYWLSINTFQLKMVILKS